VTAGITSFGAYVPASRLPLALIGGRPAKEGGPEKAVAGFDEDSVTMALAAATDCLRGVDRSEVGALYVASTTNPYAEKQAASLLAKALDLRRDVRTADFGGSLRAGTTALLAALDAAAAGSAGPVLVVASDCRLAAPRSALERNFGDGAAAFLVGSGEPAVIVEDRHSIADENLDVWRSGGADFVRTWEERFVVEHGYQECMREAAGEMMARCGLKPADFDRAVLYGPDARSHGSLARKLGFAPEQVQDPLFGRVGNTGAAFAPLLLAAALENAEAGQRLLLASYGDGADVLALLTTERLASLPPRRAVSAHLARRRQLRSYDCYLASRNLSVTEFDRRGGTGIASTVHYRDRDADISFRAMKCRGCGTEHFPAQRVCYRCHAKDDFEPVRLADGGGKVMSFTFDFFFPTSEPPTVVTMIETDGGCRVYLMMADVSPTDVRLDLPVEFTFRKIHEAGGKPNYYWKCTPAWAPNAATAAPATAGGGKP
jgi:hydroxymethylglutaryl-CoA synthase